MYNLKNIFTKNPIQISGAIMLILNFFIISGIVTLTSETVAGANGALVAILGLFVSNSTVNTAKLEDFTHDLKEKK